MISRFNRVPSRFDLSDYKRKPKKLSLPDDIMCLDITGMVLSYGNHVRICCRKYGYQYEIGLGVDGIEVRCLNGKTRLGQEISRLRGAFPKDLIAASQKSKQRLKRILGEIITDKCCVRVAQKSSGRSEKKEMGDIKPRYDFGTTDCRGFLIQILNMAGIEISHLDLIGSFALLYKANGDAYGSGVN